MSAENYHRWVRRYRDRVYTFAFYTLRQREDAEDVTQEVLIRLWRHQKKIEDGSVLSWLLKVTRNACFDALRRTKARHSRVEPAADERLLSNATCERPSPHRTAEAKDFEADLQAALGQLSPSYREIVVLREIDGLKYDEIAAITGRPLSSVKVYLHRGRKQLRDALRNHSQLPSPVEQVEETRPPRVSKSPPESVPKPGLTTASRHRKVAHA